MNEEEEFIARKHHKTNWILQEHHQECLLIYSFKKYVKKKVLKQCYYKALILRKCVTEHI